MPVLFVGHGSPMNAIEDNRWSRAFARLTDDIPRPKAILAVSAHWYVDGSFVTGNDWPRTIHDFGGFPDQLYHLQYPAPGHAGLAERVCALLGKDRASQALDWGLDHGTWSVLRWMYPEADVPVVQLGIDQRLDVRAHYALGRSLAPLRDDGVLVLGSGNIVHNLGDAFARRRSGLEETPDWAASFDEAVRDGLLQYEVERLLTLAPGTEDGRMAHPSPDHWLPLVYACAASDEHDDVSFPIEGFDWGSLSMRTVRWDAR